MESGTRSGFSIRGCGGKDWDMTAGNLRFNVLNLELDPDTGNLLLSRPLRTLRLGLYKHFVLTPRDDTRLLALKLIVCF